MINSSTDYSRMRHRLLCSVFIALALPLYAARADNSNRLWEIVQDQCVPAAKAQSGTGPCVAVDLTRRIAVLKDLIGANQYLLIPTDPVHGIEDPVILSANAPNYWEAAWEARRFMAARSGTPVPRDDVALAVNSMYARSQNQLHIHVDCVGLEIRQTLRQLAPSISSKWMTLHTPLAGHRYRALRLDGETLPVNPFKLLAKDADAATHMGEEALAVIGWEFDSRPGFIVLAHRANPVSGDFGSGEELQDHACSVLR
jgi:CDP-diacylglycerol pyrophosphatase